jgi:hypothetical protein
LINGQEYRINPAPSRAKEDSISLKASFTVLSIADIPKDLAGKTNLQYLGEEIEKRLTTEAGRLEAIPCMLKIGNPNRFSICFTYNAFLRQNETFILLDRTVHSLLGFRLCSVTKFLVGGLIALATYGSQALLVPLVQSYLPDFGGQAESISASYGYSPSAPYLTETGIQTLCLGAAGSLLYYSMRQWKEIRARYQVKNCLRKIEFAEGDSVIRSGETKRILFLVKADQLGNFQKSIFGSGLGRYFTPVRDDEVEFVIDSPQ